MFSVYILKSQKTAKFYTGYTSDITKRLHEHNSRLTKSTRYALPWILVYKKDFSSKSSARHIELKIKRMKSHAFIERLIAGNIDESFFL